MSTTASVSRSHGLNALLALVGGLAACGPASSCDPANGDSHAGLVGPSLSEQAPVSGKAPTTPAASPSPLAPRLAPATQGEARPAAPLIVPTGLAPAQESPNVAFRLRALESWAQQPRTSSVEPLLRAVDDPDERVRAKAFALLDDDWARELAAEEREGRAGR